MSLNCSKKKLGDIRKNFLGKKKKKRNGLQSPSLQGVKYSSEKPIPGVAKVEKSQSRSRQRDSAMHLLLTQTTPMCNHGKLGIKEHPAWQRDRRNGIGFTALLSCTSPVLQRKAYLSRIIFNLNTAET